MISKRIETKGVVMKDTKPKKVNMVVQRMSDAKSDSIAIVPEGSNVMYVIPTEVVTKLLHSLNEN